MQLVFEMLKGKQLVSTDVCQKTFTQSGGLIGRHQSCDWVIPDRDRHLSSFHARISFQDGAFYLTDISSNGIRDRISGACLIQGEAVRVETGSIYALGNVEIQARLSTETSNIIPDDVFLDLDPLKSIEDQADPHFGFDEQRDLDGSLHALAQCADYARIDMENLTVPQLVPIEPELAMPKVGEPARDDFWERFGTALGVDLRGLDDVARETLALEVARLLKQSISGLQQSLRGRSELKNELRLNQTTLQDLHTNPLKIGVGAAEALGMLLAGKPGQLSADQAISCAFRDLQAHQVALLAASRAAVRGTLEHFSPQQLSVRFERDRKSWLNTSGSRWRAYGRYHQTLLQEDDWSERLLSRDFTQAYEEQIRLIATLHTDLQG